MYIGSNYVVYTVVDSEDSGKRTCGRNRSDLDRQDSPQKAPKQLASICMRWFSFPSVLTERISSGSHFVWPSGQRNEELFSASVPSASTDTHAGLSCQLVNHSLFFILHNLAGIVLKGWLLCSCITLIQYVPDKKYVRSRQTKPCSFGDIFILRPTSKQRNGSSISL